jgi:hypothetical protein
MIDHDSKHNRHQTKTKAKNAAIPLYVILFSRSFFHAKEQEFSFSGKQ